MTGPAEAPNFLTIECNGDFFRLDPEVAKNVAHPQDEAHTGDGVEFMPEPQPTVLGASSTPAPQEAATPETLASIARRAGVAYNTMAKRLTPAEQARIIKLAADGERRGQPPLALPRDVADAVVARIAPSQLPHNRLPVRNVTDLFLCNEGMARYFLEQRSGRSTGLTSRLALPGGDHRMLIVDSRALRALERRFGRRPDVPRVDWNLFEHHKGYGRLLQRQLVDPRRLANIPVSEFPSGDIYHPNPSLIIHEQQVYMNRVAAHEKFLYHVALNRLRDPLLAEEFVQRTLVQAWEKREQFSDGGLDNAWSRWTTTILKNKIADYYKSATATNILVPYGAGGNDAQQEQFGNILRQTEESVQDASAHRSHDIVIAERQAAMDALRIIFNALEPRQKQLAHARFVEGKSIIETAKTFGMTESAVKTAMTRIMQKARKLEAEGLVERPDSAKGVPIQPSRHYI
jgi:RNA polymerase sigma factor (sigma-70 family)